MDVNHENVLNPRKKTQPKQTKCTERIHTARKSAENITNDVPKTKKHTKNKKHSADLEFVDWDGNFSNVNILHEGVCGGKVCCIFVDYEEKRYVLKEMKRVSNISHINITNRK